MEIFLVGGAVRDFLLGKIKGELVTAAQERAYWASVEKDWVVVGGSASQMLELGYQQVGKDFPVFLHPVTKEEYALARTERKIGKGYTEFECYADKDVTLEEDLKRRDLTINAIAMHFTEQFTRYELIDPYQGLQDLKAKLFRHVSIAFAEDPVRILRLARFATRFDDFTVVPATGQLMQQMVRSGEVDALVPQRVWQEWSATLAQKAPWRFMDILKQAKAWEKLFPKLTLCAIKKAALAAAMTDQAAKPILLAIELYDLAEEDLLDLAKRYAMPNEYKALALLVAKFYPAYLAVDQLPESILSLFEKTDAFRRPQRFKEFVQTCDLLQAAEAKKISRPSLPNLLSEILKIDTRGLLDKGLQGIDLGRALRKMRWEAIKEHLRNNAYN